MTIVDLIIVMLVMFGGLSVLFVLWELAIAAICVFSPKTKERIDKKNAEMESKEDY